MSDALEFKHYLCVFLDVLGQRTKLRRLTGIPQTDKEQAEFKSTVSETLFFVLELRRAFQVFFEKCMSGIADPPDLREDEKRRLDEFRRTKLHFQGFSDSTLIAVPLENDDENCTPMNGVHATLVAACGIPLIAMSLGHPIRGGMDVGVGTLLDTGEVYGAGLERAYWLESQVAEYPRIVVGEEFVGYLSWVRDQEAKSDAGRWAKAQAETCRKYIVQDTDGRFILDFLGPRFREESTDTINAKVVGSAYTFALKQYEDAVSTSDEKLKPRYFRLLRYFEARRSLWDNIGASKMEAGKGGPTETGP